MKKLLKRNKQHCYPLPKDYKSLVAVHVNAPYIYYPLHQVNEELWKKLLEQGVSAPVPLYYYPEKTKFKIWPDWSEEQIKIYALDA